MAWRIGLFELGAVGMLCGVASAGLAQQAGPVALTIYNQDFAVVRTTVPLDLKAGVTEVTTTEVTSQLEPDSVVLRDPAGKVAFEVGEQNYDAGVVNQATLLEKFEGKTIEFQISPGQTVLGRIIRAGRGGMQPLIEVKGVMQFQMPGMPLFPASTDGLLLKPTLRWEIGSAKPAKVNAELAYITHGMSWQATYNVVVPESKDVTGAERGEIAGWVTIQNNAGVEFSQARVKLMAGDVAKLKEMRGRAYGQAISYAMDANASSETFAPVTQSAFDDFHLYDLNRTVTLRDGETKQVEFMRAADVTLTRAYEFDGQQAGLQATLNGYNSQPTFGANGNTKVTVREEFKNSAANHMGMPLPSGRLRLYRRDAGGQMEFVGETIITHTPAEQTVKLAVGSAFDVTGERKQTDFHVNNQGRTMDETYEITLKNQKTTPVMVTVVEHMYRAQNWQITEKPIDYTKRDSHTIEIPVRVPAGGETKVSYSVRYTW
jgi:hypothetical protein